MSEHYSEANSGICALEMGQWSSVRALPHHGSVGGSIDPLTLLGPY